MIVAPAEGTAILTRGTHLRGFVEVADGDVVTVRLDRGDVVTLHSSDVMVYPRGPGHARSDVSDIRHADRVIHLAPSGVDDA